MIKECFQEYFDEVKNINRVSPIPINSRMYVSLAELNVLKQIDSLKDQSVEFITHLFTFKEGINVLLRCRFDLLELGLSRYLLSSPLVNEDSLLALLEDDDFISSADDTWVEHLYSNPNIREFDVCTLACMQI